MKLKDAPLNTLLRLTSQFNQAIPTGVVIYRINDTEIRVAGVYDIYSTEGSNATVELFNNQKWELNGLTLGDVKQGELCEIIDPCNAIARGTIGYWSSLDDYCIFSTVTDDRHTIRLFDLKVKVARVKLPVTL